MREIPRHVLLGILKLFRNMFFILFIESRAVDTIHINQKLLVSDSPKWYKVDLENKCKVKIDSKWDKADKVI